MQPTNALWSLLIFLASSSAAAANATFCPALTSCHEQGAIVVIGDVAVAAQLIAEAQDGALRFQEFFGIAAPEVAIVTGGVVDAELEQEIAAAGIANILPWISASDQRKLLEASIRKQVLAQTASLPEAQQAAMVQRALQSVQTQAAGTESGAMQVQRGALTHELGHIWFKAAFAFDADVSSTIDAQYGGSAPDWLDEVAAVLLENDVLRDSRRAALSRMESAELYPLETYLTMQHPSLESARTLAAEYAQTQGEGSRAIVLTAAEAEQFLKDSAAGDPAIFYTQTQAFIDFMMAQTNDASVFAEVARALADGESFAQYLEHQSQGLPSTVEALTAAWQNWVDARTDQ